MYDRHLLTFIQVAESGSLSRSAERLYLTPAAVMKHMNALESSLGVKLIIRSNQGVELTEAGRYIYTEAKRLVEECNGIVHEARALQRHSGRTIRVGSSFLNPGQALLDIWNRVNPQPGNFNVKIVPYSDDRAQILSVVKSLGTKLDFMVGVFGSRRMHELAGFFELGTYELCVAVPGNHPLARKSRLDISDMYGESLIIVREGDETNLGSLRSALRREHPQIRLVETDYFYDMETFNESALTGSLLLTFDVWKNVHPALVTLPVNWDFTSPYGLLYSRNISGAAGEFLAALREAMGRK